MATPNQNPTDDGQRDAAAPEASSAANDHRPDYISAAVEMAHAQAGEAPPCSLLVDPDFALSGSVRSALVGFRRLRAWRGTYSERRSKFTRAAKSIARAMSAPIDPGSIERFVEIARITGPLSVVALLYAIGTESGGRNNIQAYGFALNAFRLVWPRSYARCDLSGELVRNNCRINPQVMTEIDEFA